MELEKQILSVGPELLKLFWRAVALTADDYHTAKIWSTSMTI